MKHHRTIQSRLRHPLWILGLLFLILAAALAQTPGTAAPDRFTVATYNTQNLMDQHDDPYTQDQRTPAKSEKQIKKLAAVIRHLDADLLALQEVENEGFLNTLVKQRLGDMGYRYVVVQPTNSNFGQNLALVSRRPIVTVTSHRFRDLRLPGHDRTWRFARDLLQVRIQITPRRTIDVFVVHYKSRRDARNDPFSANHRLAEATATWTILEQLKSHDADEPWTLLMGDLNDTPDSPTLRTLLHPDADARPLLADLHAGLPDPDRVTYRLKPYRSTIDYILASPALAKRVVPGSPRMLNDRKLLSGSDHAPVVAAFDFADR